MHKKHTFGNIVIVTGVILVLAAVAVFIFQQVKEVNSVAANEEAVTFFESIFTEKTPGFKDGRTEIRMPTMGYDGTDYAAVLYVPKYSVKLPVRDSWDKDQANFVPCRFSGSAYDGTLIIGGTEREGQLAFISDIDIGDEIRLMDMTGTKFTYYVDTVKHSKNTEEQTLANGEYDLTVYAKDSESGDWMLVRCSMD